MGVPLVYYHSGVYFRAPDFWQVLELSFTGSILTAFEKPDRCACAGLPVPLHNAVCQNEQCLLEFKIIQNSTELEVLSAGSFIYVPPGVPKPNLLVGSHFAKKLVAFVSIVDRRRVLKNDNDKCSEMTATALYMTRSQRELHVGNSRRGESIEGM